jgi:bacteriocin-like protein
MRELTEKELEQVCGGTLTTENRGGQSEGNAQITSSNGNDCVKGQNKDLPKGLQC